MTMLQATLFGNGGSAWITLLAARDFIICKAECNADMMSTPQDFEWCAEFLSAADLDMLVGILGCDDMVAECLAVPYCDAYQDTLSCIHDTVDMLLFEAMTQDKE